MKAGAEPHGQRPPRRAHFSSSRPGGFDCRRAHSAPLSFSPVHFKSTRESRLAGSTAKVCCKIPAMPKYVIERNIPGAGNLKPEELKAISQTSCGVLRKMGSEIQWIQSYVTGDKIYCIYIAPDEQMVREHAKQGGFPANSIAEIKSVIDPTTAE